MDNVDKVNLLFSKLTPEEIANLTDEEILDFAMERPGYPSSYGFMFDKRYFRSERHLSETADALTKRLAKAEQMKAQDQNGQESSGEDLKTWRKVKYKGKLVDIDTVPEELKIYKNGILMGMKAPPEDYPQEGKVSGIQLPGPPMEQWPQGTATASPKPNGSAVTPERFAELANKAVENARERIRLGGDPEKQKTCPHDFDSLIGDLLHGPCVCGECGKVIAK